jgi:choice-of-anchor B domain-containing protein
LGVAAFVALSEKVSAQLNRNVTLFGRLLPNPYRYSGSWAFVAPSGAEYALVGGFEGTHVVAIDDSTNIRQVGFVSGPSSNWREITVRGNHAFVVTEGGGTSAGMQVISLAPLPDSVHLVTTYRTTFTTGHVIMRDVSVDSPYVYVSGTTTTGGVHILNVSNPALPVQVGVYDPTYYIHDAHIRGNRLYASAGSQRKVDVVDITNKNNPTLLRSIQYPGAYTHSVWTTDDHKFLFLADEQDGQVARIYNIENLTDIFQVAQYSANLQSLVHNPYIRGRYAYVAHNTEGLRVVDIADPTVPIEVGFYDTWSGPSGGFNGLWSACPFFPSRKIIGGDRTGGLFVWRFNDARAARVYGVIVDSRTRSPVRGAHVVLGSRATSSDSLGRYRIGDTASVNTAIGLQISATGYLPFTNALALNGGDSLTLNIALTPVGTAIEGTENSLSFVLHQNYPNPFNPVTHVGFRLPAEAAETGIANFGFVSLKVFDAIGREVATLVNEPLQVGHHERTFDASGLASGVYLYRLTAGDYTQTRKMLLAR